MPSRCFLQKLVYLRFILYKFSQEQKPQYPIFLYCNTSEIRMSHSVTSIVDAPAIHSFPKGHPNEQIWYLENESTNLPLFIYFHIQDILEITGVLATLSSMARASLNRMAQTLARHYLSQLGKIVNRTCQTTRRCYF